MKKMEITKDYKTARPYNPVNSWSVCYYYIFILSQLSVKFWPCGLRRSVKVQVFMGLNPIQCKFS